MVKHHSLPFFDLSFLINPPIKNIGSSNFLPSFQERSKNLLVASLAASLNKIIYPFTAKITFLIS